MTNRERNINILNKKGTDRILFQPRLETWYFKNKAAGTLPEKYRHMSNLDLYKDLNCSIRPYRLFNPCLISEVSKKVTITTIEEGVNKTTIWRTPVGSVYEQRKTINTSWHIEKFPVETPEDMKVIEYILKETSWSFNMELFMYRDAEVGDLAAPTVYIPRTNYQRLIIDFMGFENTLYNYYDYPDETAHFMEVINETDGPMLKMVAESPVKIINFGDNIDQNFLSPKIMEEWILPEYHRRVDYLKSHGKLLHSHFDGNVKNLLPYLKMTELDGIEALTPLPQGDVIIEEIKEAMGDDMVLLDGIPMTDFLPDTPIDQLIDDMNKVIKMFSPNLILGVSDEISEICDIEKIRLVSNFVNDIKLKQVV